MRAPAISDLKIPHEMIEESGARRYQIDNTGLRVARRGGIPGPCRGMSLCGSDRGRFMVKFAAEFTPGSGGSRNLEIMVRLLLSGAKKNARR